MQEGSTYNQINPKNGRIREMTLTLEDIFFKTNLNDEIINMHKQEIIESADTVLNKGVDICLNCNAVYQNGAKFKPEKIMTSDLNGNWIIEEVDSNLERHVFECNSCSTFLSIDVKSNTVVDARFGSRS